jgi:hypothetical protein
MSIGHLAQGEQGNICQQNDDVLSGFGKVRDTRLISLLLFLVTCTTCYTIYQHLSKERKMNPIKT